VPKFETGADIGQISADFERGRFETGSNEGRQPFPGWGVQAAFLEHGRGFHRVNLFLSNK